MVFIFNALNDGWTVKKINKDEYLFTKKDKSKDIHFDEYLDRFIQFNMDLENIGKN